MSKKYKVVMLDSILSRRTGFKRKLEASFQVMEMTSLAELQSQLDADTPDVVLLSLRQRGTHGLKVAKELREAGHTGVIIMVYGEKPRSLSQPRRELEETFAVNAFIPFSPEYVQLETALRAELSSRERILRQAELQQARAKAEAQAEAEAQTQGQGTQSWGELLRSDLNATTLKQLLKKPILSPRG